MTTLEILILVVALVVAAGLFVLASRRRRGIEAKRTTLASDVVGHRQEAEAHAARAQEVAPEAEEHRRVAEEHAAVAHVHETIAEEHEVAAEELSDLARRQGQAAGSHDERAVAAEDELRKTN